MEVLELNKEPLLQTAGQLFERLYEPGFLQVARYISKNGGTFEDAKDIFHDALVIFYEEGRRRQNVRSEVHYVAGIARHLWLRKFEREIKNVNIDTAPAGDTPSGDPTLDESKLLDLLLQAGKRCMDLLTAFYSDKADVLKSKLLQFKSNHAASVQKYKCLEKVREVIKTKSMSYEDFFE